MDPWGRIAGWSPAPQSGGFCRGGFVSQPTQCFGFPWIVTPLSPTIALPPPPAVPAPPGMLYPFIAAAGTPVQFDLRKDPRRANRPEFERHDRYSLFSQPVKNVRLVCKDFPWPIEIKNEWIVCGTVWEKVYHELQAYITESEWTLAGEEVRRRINRAVRFREAETGNRELRPKRIDWLGEKTLFSGLEKDNGYVDGIALPGRKETVDTWVIRLTRR